MTGAVEKRAFSEPLEKVSVRDGRLGVCLKISL